MRTVYHGEAKGCQHPYPRSPIPRIPLRLRERLIPSNPRTKRPWLFTEIGDDCVRYGSLGPTTEDMISTWRERLPSSSWLVRTGRISGVDDDLALVVLDVDYPDRAPAMPVQGWTVKTRRGYHVYSWTPDTIASGPTSWGDVKGESGLVLAPGSLHPETGQVYTPAADFGKLIDHQLPMLPQEFMPQQAAPKETVEISREGLGITGSLPAPVRAVQGERWTTLRGLLCRVAGSPARRGDTGLLVRLAHIYNSHFEPPMTEDRCERLARDIGKASASWGDTQRFRERQAAKGTESGRVRRERIRDR